MPGDSYEFIVDVVNAGSIDAMIESKKNQIKNCFWRKYKLLYRRLFQL